MSRHGSTLKLKGERLERTEQLLDGGKSVLEVAEKLNVLANMLHKAIPGGTIALAPLKKPISTSWAP